LPVFVDSLIKNRSLQVAMMSVVSSFVQLYAYGVGFLTELSRYWQGQVKPSGIRK
jgi:hypothetical protein